MPTWRKWIEGATWSSHNKDECKEEFLHTQYLREYNNLLKDKDLSKVLEENNMRLIFYPHYEMSPYIDLFETNSNDIIIADKDHYDVQSLLKESNLLITDYSSVAFDFAYMRKIVIYYQFDQEKYYKNHYQKGYFDYRENGFGPITTSVDELIIQIKDYVNGNLDIDEYLERSKSFFPLYDANNCARHYEEIIKI